VYAKEIKENKEKREIIIFRGGLFFYHLFWYSEKSITFAQMKSSSQKM
jgi:hypothetical protein